MFFAYICDAWYGTVAGRFVGPSTVTPLSETTSASPFETEVLSATWTAMSDFVVSDADRHMTGQNLVLDSGRTLT